MVWEVQANRRPTKGERIKDDLKRRMPYGKWTCDDGREVLFNRWYNPIWERSPGLSAIAADPKEHIRWARQEWYFADDDPPWAADKRIAAATRAKCEAILKGWGVGRSAEAAA